MGRILLVDDNDDSRFAVVETIRKLTNHSVDEEADGPSALARVAETSYDLVLLDVQMPGMDGFEVCRRLRADPGTRRIPVLFMTATQYQVESRLKGLDLGADDFIVQPVSNQELVARIKAALRAKALSDEVQSRNVLLETKVLERTSRAEHLADELRDERDNLRETFDVFDEALLLFDAPGQVLVSNAAGRRLNETPLAKHLTALAGEAVAKGFTCERALSQGGRSFAGRAYPVSGRRVLLCVRDVTDERDREMRRLQAEKLASIGMLAAGVAHEINNPAAFVLGNIEVLGAQVQAIEDKLRLVPDPAARSDLGTMLFEVTSILQESKEGMARIQRIVRDLSSFSHLDDEGQTLTDVNRSVESTLSLLKNELRHRATVERDLGAQRLVRASPALGQVFVNLILNAMQALDESEVKNNRIVVRTFDRGDDVIFEVSDNGPGMTPEVVTRIFDSFFTTKPRGVGTGLGLPISQGIVRAMGGDITVETQPEKGATFQVRLPAELAVRSVPPAADVAAPSYQRRRVLAVDDEALLLKAYRRMLADVHDVATALGGRDALLVLEKDRDFDLILCDLQMPEMSGMDLYAQVKALYPELSDRFVFVTGGAFSAEARRFLEQAVTCLSKPFRIEELLGIIEQKIAARTGEQSDVAATKPSRPA